MSDSQQPHKLFTRKPKKSQRSSGAPSETVASSASGSSSSKASSSADVKTPVGVASSRGSSTSSGSPLPPVGTGQPFWYRFRSTIVALFVVNVAIFGYALFNNKSTPQITEEAQPHEKATAQTEDDKQEEVAPETEDDKQEKVAPVKEVDAGTIAPEPLIPKVVSLELPTVPEEQQRELYKWMLTELRKAKPLNAAEKVDIDAQKEVLKQFIRKKELPTF